MDHGINDAVEHDAKPDPGPRLPRIGAENKRAADGEHRHAHHRSDDAVKVVLFERIVVRLMMVAVPPPPPSVHDIFVARPRNDLHRGDGNEDGSEDGGERHVDSIEMIGLDAT